MNEYFLAGFIAGEGCFGIYKLKKRPNSYNILFTIEVNKKDLRILKEIKKALKCGHLHGRYKRPKIVRFQISNKREIIDKLIPFMDRYLIASYKKKQYERWRKKVIKIWK